MNRGKWFKSGQRPDYLFLSLLLAIVIFGLIMLSSASSDLGKIRFNDTYYYIKHQLLYGLSLGIIGFAITSLVHYRFFRRFAPVFLAIGIISLILVFTPLGYRHAGANRWLNLGPFSFQPAEFLKFAFIIYLAAWLTPAKKDEGLLSLRRNSLWSGYVPFLIISGIVAVLIWIQPSTSTLVIIMSTALIIYFISGLKVSYVVLTAMIGILVLALGVSFSPYRAERVTSYFNLVFNHQLNTERSGYHLNEALIAIGNGGWTGVGFGKSTTKFKYLPEPIGDSIFAVIAEEWGFIGAAGLIALFIAFFIRGFIIAKNSRDHFAKLVTLGFVSEIAIQTFVNIAAISGIVPLTGVPLPFISYGGTSLAVFLTMAGVIVNISRYTS